MGVCKYHNCDNIKIWYECKYCLDDYNEYAKENGYFGCSQLKWVQQVNCDLKTLHFMKYQQSHEDITIVFNGIQKHYDKNSIEYKKSQEMFTKSLDLLSDMQYISRWMFYGGKFSDVRYDISRGRWLKLLKGLRSEKKMKKIKIKKTIDDYA